MLASGQYDAEKNRGDKVHPSCFHLPPWAHPFSNGDTGLDKKKTT